MATIRAYTTIEQSKKLAEILPIESADMWCHPYWDDVPNIGNADLRYNQFPCWTLAALCELMPKQIGRYTKSLYWFDDAWHCNYIDEDSEAMNDGTSADNPVDACYEMIIKLHELKML